MDPFDTLHPALQYHIVNSLGWSSLRPTQRDAIAPVRDGRHCLLLAPTAGGKTEAAIIPVLSRMLTENWTGVSVLYVCPIKALLNNLAQRLEHYAGLVGRRVELWHGDVSQSRKLRALKDPPDIILTTPESIEGMLISTRVERQTWFGSLRAVIVDELHAFASDDRGWHLRSVLARLERYAGQPPQRIGLSATVSNPEELLAWFAPSGERSVVGTASVSTDADVTLDYVGSIENAAIVISRLHRGKKRLVFCDSRSQTEQLGNLLREHGLLCFVSHASLSASERRLAETAFAEEKNCVIVATSTLELGIDVGDLDHVIQIDAPSTVSSFLQRMGRTGRRQGGLRNCLFLATNSQAFMQTLGVLQSWSEGWVEAAVPPAEPWGVVAQQIMAVTLEKGVLPISETQTLMLDLFPECAREDLCAVLRQMMLCGYVIDAGHGLMQIGPKAEQDYGRGNYRDLLASFSGSPLLVARSGNTDIGYLDPSALSRDDEPKNILLGGRSWKVAAIDWARRVVTLEPGAGGGSARWTGTGRVLGRKICRGIWRTLEAGRVKGVTFSKRAGKKVEELREVVPASEDQDYVVVRQDRDHYRVWSFGGTFANRLLARRLRKSAGVRSFDELGVDTRRDPTETLRHDCPGEFVPDETDLAAAASEVKFAACLSAEFLSRMVSARFFGIGSER